MKLTTRVSIVAFTLGSCALAAYLQKPEREALRDPSPFELYDTVQTQVLALRAQRYQEAYLQVSSRYMDRNNLERFIEAARGEVPAVRLAVRWEFGALENNGVETALPVRFFLQNGEVFEATYTFIREDRKWKIDHVHCGVVDFGSAAGMRM